ncbi:serine O-acetyltransferase [Microbacterium sp. T2.11-28]|uniref:serine O-acetyltransferase n=1 Tax=Microbacterium sp. T2.11-28 TaxID=3041169 RepID=UPI0025408FF7|nr:serine acetyltransferase [Microbacterium sp. T2.11-28]
MKRETQERGVFRDLRANALLDSPTARITPGLFARTFFTVRYQAVFLFRISQAAARRTALGGALIKQFNHVVTGADIAFPAEIGPGLILFHPTGVVIGPSVRIGSDCVMQQGVTLGSNGLHRVSEAPSPTIGDHVVLGAGARVIGPVRIEDRCIVGANAVVTKSSPEAGMTARGVPARWAVSSARVDAP